jgi:hypothetical protein
MHMNRTKRTGEHRDGDGGLDPALQAKSAKAEGPEWNDGYLTTQPTGCDCLDVDRFLLRSGRAELIPRAKGRMDSWGPNILVFLTASPSKSQSHPQRAQATVAAEQTTYQAFQNSGLEREAIRAECYTMTELRRKPKYSKLR